VAWVQDWDAPYLSMMDWRDVASVLEHAIEDFNSLQDGGSHTNSDSLGNLQSQQHTSVPT